MTLFTINELKLIEFEINKFNTEYSFRCYENDYGVFELQLMIDAEIGVQIVIAQYKNKLACLKALTILSTIDFERG